MNVFRENFECQVLNAVIIEPNHKVLDSISLKYILESPFVLKQIKGSVKGSVQGVINTAHVSDLLIPFTAEFDYAKLYKILKLIDDKIKLNNKINIELEQMAKTLYDYWFVQFDFPFDFAQDKTDEDGKPYKSSGGEMVYNEVLKREIPKGWEVDNIMKVANLLGGGTPKTNDPTFWNGGIPFFTPADSESAIYVMNTKETLTQDGLNSCSTRLYSKGTIFITARGTVGKVNIASQDMGMNQSCYALQGKDEVNSSFLYFHTLQLVNYVKSKASGSIFNALVTNDFKFTPMVIPPLTLIQKFGEKTESQFAKILNLSLIHI